jgi:SAM-dependent methyltransferase
MVRQSKCNTDGPLKPSGKGAAPSRWIARFLPRIRPGGLILDLACGGGRHARLCLELGYRVDAVDRDLDRLGNLLHQPGLHPIKLDLETGAPWPLGAGRYAGVLVANYLFRPHLPAIVEALAPGGVLIYETFAQGNAAFGRPANPDHLLRPGELIEAVVGRLSVIAYEHGRIATPQPAVIQRIAAQRAAYP